MVMVQVELGCCKRVSSDNHISPEAAAPQPQVRFSAFFDPEIRKKILWAMGAQSCPCAPLMMLTHG